MGRIGNIRVLIVDNFPLLSKGLASLIAETPGYAVAGVASKSEEALKLAEREKPHLVTLEINLGNENGMDLIPKFKAINPEIVILILSMFDERYYSERILRLGARGYIMKTAGAENMIDAIKTVMSGKVYLSENERDRFFQAMTGENNLGANWAESLRKLSDRELQVFALIGKGFGTIEIASRLELSTKTVDTHKEHIKLKLNCNTSQELRQYSIEWSNHTVNA